MRCFYYALKGGDENLIAMLILLYALYRAIVSWSRDAGRSLRRQRDGAVIPKIDTYRLNDVRGQNCSCISAVSCRTQKR
jgi:hypothetical protein